MISYIRGTLTGIKEGKIVVEAAGVGYGINVPNSVLSDLPPLGTEVKIHTYYSVKEDSQTLYGFLYEEDREMFRALLGVSGVGPKGAVAILSCLSADDLRMAVMTGDVKSICLAQGIGKRSAERIILELRDKVGTAEGFYPDVFPGNAAARQSSGEPKSAGPVAEAIEAMTALGYTRTEAGRAVGTVELKEGMTSGDVLRAALRNFKSG